MHRVGVRARPFWAQRELTFSGDRQRPEDGRPPSRGALRALADSIGTFIGGDDPAVATSANRRPQLI